MDILIVGEIMKNKVLYGLILKSGLVEEKDLKHCLEKASLEKTTDIYSLGATFYNIITGAR